MRPSGGLTVLGRYLRRRVWRWANPPKPRGFFTKATHFCAPAIVFASVVLALTALVDSLAVALPKPIKTVREWLPDDETSGQIIVDTPKVYTRERLVNDRLEEASWLESQLKKTEDELFSSRFQSVAGQLTSLRREQLAIAGQAAQGAPPDDKASASGNFRSAADQSKLSMQYPSTFKEPTIDRFRDLHTFREEARAEMMQTQLDDRHDLGGNTVYRLTFDTTIISGSHTRELALINIDLAKGAPDYNVEIFDDWKSKVERDSAKLLRSQLRAIIGNGLSPDDQTDMFSFFANQTCQFFPKENRPACLADIPQFIDWYTKERQTPIIDFIFDRLKYVNNKDLVMDIYTQYNAFCYQSLITKVGVSISTITFEVPPIAFDTPDGKIQDIPCAPFGGGIDVAIYSPYYKLFAIIDLYDRVKHDQERPGKLDVTNIKSKCSAGRGGGKTDNDAFKSKGGGIQAQQCPPLLPGQNSDIFRCAIAQYTKDDLNKRAKEISRYFSVFIDGDNIDSCKIKICDPTAGSNSDCDPLNKPADGSPANKLADKLKDRTSIFSYAITPKNMVQRIGIASGESDILSTGGRAEAEGHLAVQEIAVLKERSRNLELAEGFPIIVGLGSNEPSSPEDDDKIKAHFGWVIAPSLRSGKDTLPGQYLQSMQQYTLAAVVSVPSWWRSAKVTYRVCWASPYNLTPKSWKERSECTSTPEEWDVTIELPGRIEEINRKLRFWVINEPNLDEDQKWTLTAGRKQAMVIRGSRLWRSTAVTLGSQKANRIEVLPNMNGIIATFDCLQDPAQNEVPKLEVWTSEGATPPQSVTVYPSSPLSSCSEDGTPLPVKAAADVPSLDDGQQWTLTGGRKQDIVVRGKRLWYGTVVTLGSQKADRIELLPGANGVIATFDCLQDQKEPTMLQAWTSEGVTRPVSVAVSRAEDGWYCENNKPKTAGPVAGRNDGASGLLPQPASGVAAQPSTTAGGTSAEGVPQVP